ncbi:MAG: glycosyltransferase family 9 protein [Candidatus Erginobacter occultus]|nr:glycosyltransferase family 9 protein [Candidatus Erginobacter occultus]
MERFGKILIVKLGSIGDVVNTLPLVNALREGFPEAEIGWLIEPKSFPIVEGQEAVDRFIIHRRGGGAAAARGALGEIRSFEPDLVIDLQRILRSSFFTFFSGCPRRLGFDRRRSKELSWLFTNRKIPAGDPKRHMVSQYLEFAEFLGLPTPGVSFRIPVGESDRAAARKLLPEGYLQRGFIALNVGAAKSANRWPVSRWAELANLILSRRREAVVLTGGGEDRARGRSIADLTDNRDRLFDCTGKTSLKELGGVFSLARAAVSGDSGPMHIASALGVLTVGIFGPADPSRTGPFRHLELAVRAAASCAPCGRRTCRRPRCLEEIAAETVLERIFPAGDA